MVVAVYGINDFSEEVVEVGNICCSRFVVLFLVHYHLLMVFFCYTVGLFFVVIPFSAVLFSVVVLLLFLPR